jgi:hypothetical protein
MSQFEDRIISLVRQIFGEVTIKRELAVKKLFPSYQSGLDRYDLVLPGLKIIIECHGQQHKKIVSFGKEDKLTAYKRFVHQKYRDSRKRDIALENNWSYVVIWYNEMRKDDEKNILLLKEKIFNSI